MTNLKVAEEALKECQRLLKASHDYEWLYWNTDYPQRVDQRIAEALDAIQDIKSQLHLCMYCTSFVCVCAAGGRNNTGVSIGLSKNKQS